MFCIGSKFGAPPLERFKSPFPAPFSLAMASVIQLPDLHCLAASLFSIPRAHHDFKCPVDTNAVGLLLRYGWAWVTGLGLQHVELAWVHNTSKRLFRGRIGHFHMVVGDGSPTALAASPFLPQPYVPVWSAIAIATDSSCARRLPPYFAHVKGKLYLDLVLLFC